MTIKWENACKVLLGNQYQVTIVITKTFKYFCLPCPVYMGKKKNFFSRGKFLEQISLWLATNLK